ncbi:transporter substrate-binding domain-containing protein [Paenibacillus sp. GCM10012307]|uniref:Transporter substrate-binding domain-containing protein n=1 Tax=Paenibacillus roseus TaxID=2798579 RepID=A0A934J2T0_9BACL|nr:transporter substrate-binding domain-containing protein [Paenibacillus roseus]MBJ6363721.1 transporter substrate-binding domain-containing protein [Paenibacillus roseus]
MKKASVIAGILALFLVISGCGSSNGSGGGKTDTGSTGGSEPAKQVKKIIVGTGTKFPNVCFIDENGKLTGFDVELVKEIDKRLPEYEFELKTMEFSSLLLGLETNKIDFVAHQMEKNPDREAKYLFTKEPYSIFLTKVAVDKDNDTIQSIQDLKGKKVYTSATSNQAFFLQEYNKKNNDPFEIVYSSGAANDLVNLIKSKRVDATITTDFALRFYLDADGKQALKTVGEPLIQSDVLFVLRKDSQELADKIDEAVKSIKEDGTLAKLSIEWLGQDFTKGINEASK